MWLSAIDEDVHYDKKPVGALVHSIQAVSDHHVFSHTFDIHVVQGKACYHVVGDGCDDQASKNHSTNTPRQTGETILTLERAVQSTPKRQWSSLLSFQN